MRKRSRSTNALAAFGYSVPKPYKRSAEAVIAATAKAKATRAARHTMGKKQRASIHGVVATPEPSAPSSLPAPSTTQK
jgi:hypothetical protein